MRAAPGGAEVARTLTHTRADLRGLPGIEEVRPGMFFLKLGFMVQSGTELLRVRGPCLLALAPAKLPLLPTPER